MRAQVVAEHLVPAGVGDVEDAPERLDVVRQHEPRRRRRARSRRDGEGHEQE
jgi:hypothetical protein